MKAKPCAVFRSLSEVPQDFGPAALTIGNFDGVHAGHRYIMREVTRIAQANGWKPSVLTFDPHPAKVVAPARAPKLMTTIDQRCELMSEEGIAQVAVLPFDETVARWSPEEFVRTVVVDKLQTRAVLVGGDFRFGHKQAGDVQLLRALGTKYGFTTQVIEPVTLRGQRVSSSLVRQMVESGRVSPACRLLGRPYALEGEVVSGEGIGSRQTVPTLNLAATSEVLPKIGVYVTRTTALDDARGWESITNVGFRPTFGGQALTIETFLLGQIGGEAPVRIRVEFLYRVRDERKFDSAEALKAQIFRDVGRARRYFRRLAGFKK